MSQLAIHLFGPLCIELDGEEVRIPRRKALALLAYLAATRRTHSRDSLASLLWPEYDQSSARAELRRALSSLNRTIGHEHLLIDRDTAALDMNAGFWVDVQSFEEAVAACAEHDPPPSPPCPACVYRLAEAVALYEDEFLAGFSLPDSEPFDDWQRLEAQHLRGELANALQRLGQGYVAQGEYEHAVSSTQRWLALDPFDEAAHRALMDLYAQTGQRAAALRQYRQCVRTLERELDVEPSPETAALYQQIREARGPAVGVAPAAVRHEEAPAFLDAEDSDIAQPVFVGRERELTRLDGFLQSALSGHGTVAFVTGEAGEGKTALLRAFARRASAAHPELLVAWGACDALVGAGVPYMPFREVLEMLTGEVERAWNSGVVTRDQARQLWRSAPRVLGLLVDRGAALLDTLLPAQGVLARAQILLHADAAVLARLRARADAGAAVHLAQAELFAQLTDLMREFSIRRPLVLLLDDLQWADSASAELLFHLSNRLAGSRVLILGAYRPSDLRTAVARSATAAPAHHPLHEVVLEVQRRYGDRSVQLEGATEEERRDWIDTLLDSEPNQLDTAFRDALFERTGAHPLFTVELLRAMQDRGDLARDSQGRWAQSEEVRWDQLPARVEAVIEERLAGLDPFLRELLALASIEGETFTAQVVAAVQGTSERQVLRGLSQELVAGHRLLQDLGEAKVSGRFLSRYRFTHALFQQYLYRHLSAGERRLLHGEVAEALEAAHAGHTDEMAAQLGHHYAEAGIVDKAVAYLSLAGDHARLAYAHEEALAHYERALRLLRDGGHDDRAARLLMKIGLAHHAAFDFRAAELAYSEGFARWRYTQQPKGATLPEAPHALRLVWYPPRTLDPAMCGDAASGPLIEQLHSGLVDLTPDVTVVPDVANDWQIAKGGCEYTFRLRRDVCWTDGAPVTAHDFAYAWRRVLDPALGSPSARMLYDIKGAEAYHQGYGHVEDVGVRAEGDRTLVVELKQPACQFLYLLTHIPLLPVPQHVLEAQGGAWDEIADHVSNGPFKLGPRRTRDRVVLIRNRAYHGTYSGNVSQVEIRLVDPPDWAAGLADYAADVLDIYALTELSPAEMARALSQYAADHVAAPALVVHFFVFDTAHPPFDDLRIRRAFTMALDRAQLASLVTAGTMAPALGGLLPAGMPGHSPGMGLPHDPAQARSLLAEAGYLGGDRFPPVRVLTAPGPITDAFTEEACAQWRQKLGIEVTIQGTHDWREFYRRVPSELPSLFSGGWLADYPDPDNFLRVGLPSQMVGWQNEDYRRLVEEAARCQDQPQRLAQYREADRILVEEAAVLPLVYQRWHLLIKPWVTRYPISPQGCWFWKDAVIEPH